MFLFIRNFADRCHHTKEETLLFSALEKAGMPREQGPIGVMLAEHDEGRGYVRAMAEALAAYRQGDISAAPALIGAARGYSTLLRGHIWKEDNVLFPMADQMLPDETQQELLAAFDRVEEEHMGKGEHERYHGVLDQLEAAIAAASASR